MSKLIVNREIAKLTPSSLIELFELDTTNINGNRLPESNQVIRFHNYVSEGYFPIYFGSVKYSAIPVQFKNNEVKGDGTTLPRPRLNVGNTDGMVSYYLRQTNGLVGARLQRKRTFARFLSGETWGLPYNQNPIGSPDADAALSDDVFFVERIVSENKQVVEFELSSILEMNKLKLPRRRMFANNCSFEYRNSTGCDYAGAPKADVADKKFDSTGYNLTLANRGKWDVSTNYDKGDYVYIESPFLREDGGGLKRFYYVCLTNGTIGAEHRPPISSNWKLDMCSRKINGCLCRFSDNNLPFGGFPALVRVEMDN